MFFIGFPWGFGGFWPVSEGVGGVFGLNLVDVCCILRGFLMDFRRFEVEDGQEELSSNQARRLQAVEEKVEAMVPKALQVESQARAHFGARPWAFDGFLHVFGLF